MRYSDEELLNYIKELYIKLERTPTKRDLEKYDAGTYKRHFGSWNNALIKAGFNINRKFYTDEEILGWIRNFYNTHGYSPSQSDFIKQFKDTKLFRSRWDNWSNTLKEAGVPVRKQYPELSKEEMLDRLIEVSKKLGRAPKRLEFSKYGLPAPDTYLKKFNVKHLADIFDIAGAKNIFTIKRNLEKEQLIKELKEVAEQLGHVPSSTEMERIAKYSSYSSAYVYKKVFGSWNNALIEAGFKPRPVQKAPTKEEILKTAKKILQEEGKLTYKLFEKYGIKEWHFLKYGGIGKIKERFGLTPRPGKYSKKDCVDAILTIYERLGRVPSKSEYIFYRKKYYKFLPSYNTILFSFEGSWNKAVEEAKKYLKG
jgi:sulfur relay (sulfurtransferase) DsrC/TusE family protein